MSYSYAEHRSFVFTEEGSGKLLDVIAQAASCLDHSEAVQAGVLLHAAGSGDSWSNMAVVDRLVEAGYLRLITDSAVTPHWQDRVFIRGHKAPP